jgi:hypothetical protein
MDGIDPAGISPALLEPRVSASCFTDDHHVEVDNFDASPC